MRSRSHTGSAGPGGGLSSSRYAGGACVFHSTTWRSEERSSRTGHTGTAEFTRLVVTITYYTDHKYGTQAKFGGGAHRPRRH